MSSASHYHFGPFSFDIRGRLLFKGAQDVGLPPKAAETLLVLLASAGEVVEKATLLDTVWAGTVVGEGSLTRTISILRKALGGDTADGTYIATVSKRGYRFVAPLERAAARATQAEDRRVMLAVLPFDDLSPGRPGAYFADGLTEEMIAQLSRLNAERLGVIARTSSMMFKGTRKRIGEIGAELGVHYVLEGSVRRGRGRIRVAAQLIQVSDETHVWADNYERPAGDVLRLQCDVATAIAREIQIKLTPQAARRLSDAQSIPAGAYEACLKGRHFLNQRTEKAMRESIRHFELSLRQCPSYAPAHAGIADAYVMLACRGMVPAKETFQRARAAAQRALEFDSGLGDAHGSLAHVRLHDWDWEGLDQAFRRATALSPSLAIVYYWYAEYLMSQQRRDEALASAELAYRMDPLSPVIRSSLGMIRYLARRNREAAELLVQACETNPEHFLPHMRLGLVRIQQRRYDDAIRLLKTAMRLADRSTETMAALGMAYAASGRKPQAARIVTQLEALRGRRYVLPYNIAKIHAAGRDRAKTLQWLETAYEGGNPDLIELNSEPVFDFLRSEPRFNHLMSRIGFTTSRSDHTG
ncbi:MAG TPA: winged helix-turn-helix domain-containing protein [Steroidobacteraceae bacterium]|nr:winged helix-turn-helix domain-containing protein [Steroidobacteraceae bacterium]